MCRRRGAVVAFVSLEGIKCYKGADKLSLYQFNTLTAKHYFCRACGIYTHHQGRSNTEQFAINVACIEGLTLIRLVRSLYLMGLTTPQTVKNLRLSMTDKTKLCPLCQGFNLCGARVGNSIEQCWCSKQTFPDKRLLAQVLESDKLAKLNGTTCICESCLVSLQADITAQQTLYKRID